MSERARALAERYERANEELIATIAGCADDHWRASCSDTGWAVGVQADHLGVAQAVIAEHIGAIARGEPLPPLPMAVINQANDQRAGQAAEISKEEAIALLRQNGAAMAEMIRGLDEEQLGRSGQIVAELPAHSVEQWIEYLAIGELERHGGCIRQAISD